MDRHEIDVQTLRFNFDGVLAPVHVQKTNCACADCHFLEEMLSYSLFVLHAAAERDKCSVSVHVRAQSRKPC